MKRLWMYELIGSCHIFWKHVYWPWMVKRRKKSQKKNIKLFWKIKLIHRIINLLKGKGFMNWTLNCFRIYSIIRTPGDFFRFPDFERMCARNNSGKVESLQPIWFKSQKFNRELEIRFVYHLRKHLLWINRKF